MLMEAPAYWLLIAGSLPPAALSLHLRLCAGALLAPTMPCVASCGASAPAGGRLEPQDPTRCRGREKKRGSFGEEAPCRYWRSFPPR